MKQTIQSAPNFWLYKPAIRWAAIAFSIRLVLCLVLHSVLLGGDANGLMPNFHDDVLYWKVSGALQEGHQPEYIPGIYPYVLSGLFTLTGRSVLIGKLLNVIANSITVYLSVLIVHHLGRSLKFSNYGVRQSANWSGALLALYPSQVFYSTQLVKDPILMAFGTGCLYFAILLFQSRQWRFVTGLALSLFGLMLFRVYAAIAVLLSLLIYLLFIWKVTFQKRLLLVAAILLPCALIPYFLGYGLFASDYLLPWLDWQKISEFRELSYSSGESAADISVDYSSILGFLSTYSLSYLTVLLGPFPWQVRSLFQSVALPEAIAVFGLVGMLLFGLLRKSSNFKLKEANLLIIFSLLLVGVVAVFSDSIGGNTRLRMLAWNALFLYTPLVIQASRMKMQQSQINQTATMTNLLR